MVNHLSMSELSQSTLIDIVQAQRYGAEYQPIVSLETGETFGYEALSRFYDKQGDLVRPDVVYAALHDNPITLFQVEYAQKKVQLGNADKSKTLFVNLDQDAFFAAGTEALDCPFMQLVKGYGRDKVVVELIENSEVNDALMSLTMIEAFSSLGIGTAIDDLCNPRSMISIAVMQLVDWVKLDKYVVTMKHDKNFMLFVKKMIEFAKLTNKNIILEGVESREDLEFARYLGVDFVQGFYFRERFLVVKP
ncbi:EAL domain-containing protein [Marinomonas balearica]|uniref:EAL domain-containing protein (Putative c-di-GMP-specific phosphodiesterase class I) n=1 Tax=Marinomonas balearica TaxID=491947 RepID=A0A4R6M623_9GAMM|nr:EAL domain-containing protein [Marinomonas balearica]TDO96818.1 EAL domain-containing protein (putative c-di-GMP-specific phosphodiesterase class I) [Marinomonas balearica]